MTTASKAHFSLAFFAVLAAGCIPTRDNPHDPSRAPEAKLAAEVCPPEATFVDPCPSAHEGTRATRFRFNASGSRDPHGDDDALRFRWDLDASGDFATDTGHVPFVVTTVGLPAASLPSTGVGSAPRPVRVRVLASGGRRAIAEASVIITNLAPEVDPGEDLFVPEGLGGDVLLDACGGMPLAACTSFDPDLDALEWDWERLDGPMPLDAAAEDSGRQLRFTASVEPDTMIFRVSASDGLVTRSRLTRVVIGTQLWVQTFAPAQLFRIFPEFSIAVNTSGEVYAVAASPNGEIWTATYGRDLRVYRPNLDGARASHTLTDPPADPVNPFIESIAATEDGGVCVAFKSSPGRAGFVRFDSEAQQTGIAIVTTPINTRVTVRNGPEPNTCWALDQHSVFLFAADATLTPVVTNVFAYSEQTAVSPDGTLWVADVTATGDVIHRISPNGVESIAHTADAISALMADPRGDGVWFADPFTRRVSHLREGGTIEMLESIDVLTSEMVSDPDDGSLWIVDNYRSAILHFLEVDGKYVQDGEATFASIGHPELGPAGGLAGGVAVETGTNRLILGLRRNDGSGGGVAAIPANLQRTAVVPFSTVTNTYAMSIEPTRGTLWGIAAGAFPPVERLASSGRSLARAQVDADLGALVALEDGSAWAAHIPPFGEDDGRFLKLGPHGDVLADITIPDHTVIYFEGDESAFCAAFDANNSPARSGTVAVNGTNLGVTLHPVTPNVAVHHPAKAVDGSCWFYDSPMSDCTVDTRIQHFPIDATSPDVDIAAGSCPRAITTDPFDSSAWLVTRNGPAWALLHVALNGSMTSYPLPLAGIAGLHVRKSCKDAGSLACRELWYFDGSTVSKAIGSAPEVLIDQYRLPGTPASTLGIGGLTARP